MKIFVCIILIGCYYGVATEATRYFSKEECWTDCWNRGSGAFEVGCARACADYPLAKVPATYYQCKIDCEDGQYTPLVKLNCLSNCNQLFRRN